MYIRTYIRNREKTCISFFPVSYTVELLLLPIEGTGEFFGNKTSFAIREVMRKIVHTSIIVVYTYLYYRRVVKNFRYLA